MGRSGLSPLPRRPGVGREYRTVELDAHTETITDFLKRIDEYVLVPSIWEPSHRSRKASACWSGAIGFSSFDAGLRYYVPEDPEKPVGQFGGNRVSGHFVLASGRHHWRPADD